MIINSIQNSNLKMVSMNIIHRQCRIVLYKKTTKMKYLKQRIPDYIAAKVDEKDEKDNSELLNDEAERIANTMINTMYGKTIYAPNGRRLDKMGPNYNTYTINTVEYSIFPNVGQVIILHDKSASLADLIKIKFMSKLGSIQKIFPFLTASSNTAQYTLNINPSVTHVIVHIDTRTKQPRSTSKKQSFEWYLHTNVITSNLYLHEFATNENILMSLGTIIYDACNYFTLSDEYMSPDYPSLNSYTAVATKRVYNKLMMLYKNIDAEIYEITNESFVDVTKNKLGRVNHIFKPNTSHSVFWIRWEDIKPRKKIGNAFIEFQISACDTLPMAGDSNPVCFITNSPIYSDCYVIDIYSQSIWNILKHLLYDTNGKRLTCDEYKTPTLSIFDGINMDILIKTVIKQITFTHLPKNTVDAVLAFANTMKYNVNWDTYEVKYDVPIHLLMHKYALHKINSSSYLMNNYKYIMYRSFCPLTRLEVCKNITDIDPVHKYILERLADVPEINYQIIRNGIFVIENVQSKILNVLLGNVKLLPDTVCVISSN